MRFHDSVVQGKIMNRHISLGHFVNARIYLFRNNREWLFELPVFLQTWFVHHCTKKIHLREEMSPKAEKQQNIYLEVGRSEPLRERQLFKLFSRLMCCFHT